MACNEQTPALVRSTFELPSELQSRIRSVLEERFGQTIALTFTTTPELISGIELSTQEQNWLEYRRLLTERIFKPIGEF